ncbi:hypothetical protein E2P81_ATG09139 [Venturia nashicola]|uniref:Uncharacterized protein n=1 Tax=Venturia nashicola TaxID=86259 RepID=A0A4Z1NFY1_9PEZI|nr:hypothetical protein E6O75_ATG09340 [Venturia nashicola]TLD20069.1 hypothetical protein E2P81_ATG09139 [Venturia nashicola]
MLAEPDSASAYIVSPGQMAKLPSHQPNIHLTPRNTSKNNAMATGSAQTRKGLYHQLSTQSYSSIQPQNRSSPLPKSGPPNARTSLKAWTFGENPTSGCLRSYIRRIPSLGLAVFGILHARFM